MITEQPDLRRAQAHNAEISSLYQFYDLAVAAVRAQEAAIEKYWEAYWQ